MSESIDRALGVARGDAKGVAHIGAGGVAHAGAGGVAHADAGGVAHAGADGAARANGAMRASEPRPRASRAFTLPARRLAALIVNYDSGAFAVRCIESVRDEWARLGFAPSKLEIVLVDNRSNVDQSVWLARAAALGAHVVANSHNAGYAGGMNLAYTYTSGSDDDWVAVLNPDLRFLPGSLEPLLRAIERDRKVGAVAPRAYLDEDRKLLLPPNAMPTPFELARTELAAVSPRAARAYAKERLARSLAWWTTHEPTRAEMLSGACLVLRRGTVRELGMLFDERYPLYFEDADLARRIASAGLVQLFEPRSVVLHHWSRSAGSGSAFEGEPMTRYHVSRRAFVAKHFGARGELLESLSRRVVQKWPARGRFRSIHPLIDLGASDGPISIPLGRRSRYVVDIGLSPVWILGAGALGKGDTFTFTSNTWSWLFPGRYFARAFVREGDGASARARTFLGAWTFVKTSAARSAPELERTAVASASA